jgi:hypothetical protein
LDIGYRNIIGSSAMTNRLLQFLRKEIRHIIIIFFLFFLALYLKTLDPIIISALYIGFLYKKRRYGDINNFDDLSNAGKTGCILIMFIISIYLMGNLIIGKTVNNIIFLFVSLKDYWFGYRVLIMKKFQKDINKKRLAFEIAYFLLYESLLFSTILPK